MVLHSNSSTDIPMVRLHFQGASSGYKIYDTCRNVDRRRGDASSLVTVPTDACLRSEVSQSLKWA